MMQISATPNESCDSELPSHYGPIYYPVNIRCVVLAASGSAGVAMTIAACMPIHGTGSADWRRIEGGGIGRTCAECAILLWIPCRRARRTAEKSASRP